MLAYLSCVVLGSIRVVGGLVAGVRLHVLRSLELCSPKLLSACVLTDFLQSYCSLYYVCECAKSECPGV